MPYLGGGEHFSKRKPSMQLDQLLELARAHKWAALAAFLIYWIVRLLKSDTKIPIDIPPRGRAPLALALGVLAGVLDKFAQGTTWTDALTWGIGAAMFAIFGHNIITQSLLGGREIPVPLLMKETAPATMKTPSVPPLPTLFMMIVVVITAAWTVSIVGCGAGAQGAKSPARDYARATLILVAEATKAADGVCADLAKQKSDAKLAKTCADAYDATRASLLAAQSLVDGWESADQKSYMCTLGHGVQGLGSMASAVQSAGGKLPPVIVDALSLGGSFVKGCSS